MIFNDNNIIIQVVNIILIQDIKLRDEVSRLSKLSKKAAEIETHISKRLLHSLRVII